MKFVKKYKKIILSFLVVFILGAGWFTGDYFYNFALNPKVNKDKVSNQDDDGVVDPRKEINMKWFDENKQEHSMNSVTGVKLKGYTFVHKDSKEEAQARKWVVVTHGFFIEAKKAANYIRGFYDRGYNVFAPDLIGHGKSEGKAYSMGGYDSTDLVSWVKKVSTENNNPQIVLFGISMGAATTMNSLNKGLPDNVKGFIEDSGYVNLKEEFVYQLDKMFGLPSFPVIPLANMVTKIKAGYNFGDVDASEALKTTKLPALILHGDADGYVPLANAQKAYELLTSNKEIHIFKDSKHCKAERKYNEEYWSYIEKFLNKVYK
ncbi:MULTISPECIES: alpha/beta hydrolase [unclassified Gemella]|uniref:alpha/beta hydrolase n=1 Tax=unclassified Gemella TaxID=2624949 RepID=UPI001C044855|nr:MULTISPECIES: alpha/beta fold hydrolase [unclassified Gemella]MBU0278965.1 lysophospholipase [Gemella sp. zg-1178]QWQ39073.1 lysophospholipase [Gemella sp. zg-570]